MSINRVQQVRPPALPQAPREYRVQFQDQYSNVLRLFFNNLDSAFNGLLSSDNGGALLFKPHATYYSVQDQTHTSTNSPKAVSFENTVDENGVEINGVNSTEITLNFPGYWQFSTTLQVLSANSSTKAITAWLRVNGVDVPYSAHRVTFIKQGYDQLTYTHGAAFSVGDVVEVMWSTDSTSLKLEQEAPNGVHPGIASATVAVQYQSNENI